MEKNKTEALKECFNLLDAEYGEKLTEQTRIFKKELFKKMIGEYPEEKIKAMVMEMIRTRVYNSFPLISEMVAIIEGKKEEEAELAWIYLMEKIRNEGYYQSVTFQKYPAVGGFIEVNGGWLKFLDKMTDAQEVWIKKDFIKLYPIIKKRGDYPKRFPGYFEITNAGKGYESNQMLEKYSMTLEGRKVQIIEQKKIQEERSDVKKIEGRSNQ